MCFWILRISGILLLLSWLLPLLRCSQETCVMHFGGLGGAASGFRLSRMAERGPHWVSLNVGRSEQRLMLMWERLAVPLNRCRSQSRSYKACQGHRATVPSVKSTCPKRRFLGAGILRTPNSGLSCFSRRSWHTWRKREFLSTAWLCQEWPQQAAHHTPTFPNTITCKANSRWNLPDGNFLRYLV